MTDLIENKEKPDQEPFILDITDDLYCGNLPEDMLQSFVCILCYGIVFKPVKCV